MTESFALDDLEIIPPEVRLHGPAEYDIEITYLRDLTEPEIGLLNSEARAPAGQLQKIKDSHHRLAQMLAQGFRRYEVAGATGYTPERITMLTNDPAFQELLEFYRAEYRAGVATRAVDLTTRMTSFLEDGIAELHERLLDKPDDMGTGTLLEAVKVLSDRAGYGPTSKQINVNVNLADRLQEARKRAGLIEGPVKEGTGNVSGA